METLYERHADAFIEARTGVGAKVIERWARAQLVPGGSVLDLGCGTGFPVSWVLSRNGLSVFGLDSAPSLVVAFKASFPDLTVRCEDVFDSDFYGRGFDAVTMVGLLFLLPEARQPALIAKAAKALKPGGRLLFSAPTQCHRWTDSLTGGPALSLGYTRYRDMLERNGLRIIGSFRDEGGNHYYDAADTRRLANST